MCPFCLATVAMIAGSIAGTGGIAAAVTGVILRKKSPMRFPTQTDEKEVQHGNNGCDCSDAA